jgi:hypothetical protein
MFEIRKASLFNLLFELHNRVVVVNESRYKARRVGRFGENLLVKIKSAQIP